MCIYICFVIYYGNITRDTIFSFLYYYTILTVAYQLSLCSYNTGHISATRERDLTTVNQLCLVVSAYRPVWTVKF